MTQETYNGWTNYETWRVNLEMIDGDNHASENDFDTYTLGQHLREMVEGIVSEQAEGLALDYALTFLDAVNWREIAQSQIDAYRTEEVERCAYCGEGKDAMDETKTGWQCNDCEQWNGEQDA